VRWRFRPILARPIDWEIIRSQYDEMVKYTTALRLGTAQPEDILRRFARSGLRHPTYRALDELGRAVKTRFLCHHLDDEALRREIQEGLNVVENWNSANRFVFYGKSGEIATIRHDEQETAALALHLIQASLVYVNTLMLQEVLGQPGWLERMTSEDLRALPTLIYHHINPYGTFELEPGQALAPCFGLKPNGAAGPQFHKPTLIWHLVAGALTWGLLRPLPAGRGGPRHGRRGDRHGRHPPGRRLEGRAHGPALHPQARGAGRGHGAVLRARDGVRQGARPAALQSWCNPASRSPEDESDALRRGGRVGRRRQAPHLLPSPSWRLSPPLPGSILTPV